MIKVVVGRRFGKLKPKGLTAAQIAKGKLDPLGKQIAAHLQRMQAYEAKAHAKAGVELKKADDHWTSITQLLAEAKAKCDGGGFNTFKKKYCPDIGRSRVYELLAIGSGRKTLEGNRAEKRKRVAKSRRVSATSASVADSSEGAPPTADDNKSGNGSAEPKPWYCKKDGHTDRGLERFAIAIGKCTAAGRVETAKIKFPPNLPAEAVAMFREDIKEAFDGLRELDARFAAYSGSSEAALRR